MRRTWSNYAYEALSRGCDTGSTRTHACVMRRWQMCPCQCWATWHNTPYLYLCHDKAKLAALAVADDPCVVLGGSTVAPFPCDPDTTRNSIKAQNSLELTFSMLDLNSSDRKSEPELPCSPARDRSTEPPTKPSWRHATSASLLSNDCEQTAPYASPEKTWRAPVA